MADQVVSSRKLARTALRHFWRFKWPLIGLLAVVAVPLALLGNLAGLGQDAQFSAYSSFLSIIMNVALIWMIVQLRRGHRPTIRDAYYRGTGTLVRFMLVAVMLTLMLVPFLIGALVYVSGISGATLAASTGEKLVLGLVWLVFAIPTIWLIARYFLGVYALVADDMTPIAALRHSGAIVRGHTGKVIGRLVVLGVGAIVVLSVPAVAVIAGGQSLLVALGLTALQLISTLLVLPFANLYLYGLYRMLADDQG